MRSDRRRWFWTQPLAFAIMVTLGVTGVRFFRGELQQFAWIAGSGVIGGLVALAAGKIAKRSAGSDPERRVDGSPEE